MVRHTVSRHEIGHVLVALACGKKVSRTFVNEDGGHTVYPDRTSAADEMAIAVAGHVAEAMADWSGPSALLTVFVPWDGQDMRALLTAGDELTGGDNDQLPALVNLAVLTAMRSLDATWDVFDGLTRALSIHGTLETGDIVLDGPQPGLDVRQLAAAFAVDINGFTVMVGPEASVSPINDAAVAVTYGRDLAA